MHRRTFVAALAALAFPVSAYAQRIPEITVYLNPT